MSGQPVKLSENIVFLGEIPVVHDFEPRNPIGKTIRENRKVADYLYDDSALVNQSAEGLFIITGCSHNGICNITAFPWQLKSKWEKNWRSGKSA